MVGFGTIYSMQNKFYLLILHNTVTIVVVRGSIELSKRMLLMHANKVNRITYKNISLFLKLKEILYVLVIF